MTLLTPTETAAPAQRTAPRGEELSAPSTTPVAAPVAPAVAASPAADDRGWLPATPLAQALGQLAADGWTLLSDLRWTGRWTAPLAHLLVGPGGVVVVDADARPWRLTPDSTLRLGRRDGRRECRAAAQRAADVASLLHHEHRGAVHAYLCLTAQPLPAVQVDGGVTATGVHGLVAALREAPVLLDAVDVRQVSAHLRWQLSARGDRVEPAGTGEPVDRGAALLGLVPSQRPATDVGDVPAPAAVVTGFATRREALAAEKELARGPR